MHGFLCGVALEEYQIPLRLRRIALDWIQWLLSFIGVLGLIFVLFYFLKKLNKRISTGGGRLKVLDRISIGRDGMLLVVSVCGKVMLVGVTSQRIDRLCDLDITEEEYSAERQSTDFASVFTAISAMKDKKAQQGELSEKQGETPDEVASENGNTTE